MALARLEGVAYEALGFNEVARAPIRDEAINVFMGLADDGPKPRLELTHNFDQTEPYKSAPATATSRSPPRISTRP